MRVGRDTGRLLCGVGGECITRLGEGSDLRKVTEKTWEKAKVRIQGKMGRESGASGVQLLLSTGSVR